MERVSMCRRQLILHILQTYFNLGLTQALVKYINTCIFICYNLVSNKILLAAQKTESCVLNNLNLFIYVSNVSGCKAFMSVNKWVLLKLTFDLADVMMKWSVTWQNGLPWFFGRKGRVCSKAHFIPNCFSQKYSCMWINEKAHGVSSCNEARAWHTLSRFCYSLLGSDKIRERAVLWLH